MPIHNWHHVNLRIYVFIPWHTVVWPKKQVHQWSFFFSEHVAVKQSEPPGFVSTVTEAFHLRDHKLKASCSWLASDTWYSIWVTACPLFLKRRSLSAGYSISIKPSSASQHRNQMGLQSVFPTKKKIVLPYKMQICFRSRDFWIWIQCGVQYSYKPNY